MTSHPWPPHWGKILMWLNPHWLKGQLSIYSNHTLTLCYFSHSGYPLACILFSPLVFLHIGGISGGVLKQVAANLFFYVLLHSLLWSTMTLHLYISDEEDTDLPSPSVSVTRYSPVMLSKDAAICV